MISTATRTTVTLLSKRTFKAAANAMSTLSFASPFADFCADARGQASYFATINDKLPVPLSFASPESDFAMGSCLPVSAYATSSSASAVAARAMVEKSMSFASPESDFCASPSYSSMDMLPPAQLSFSSPESDFVGVAARAHVLSEVQKPISFNEAIMPSPQPRIITEAMPPFKVVHSNDAWREVMNNNTSLGHTLAMANLNALGRPTAVTAVSASSHIKVAHLENNFLLSVLESTQSQYGAK
jgi:hypothetical protein